MDALEKLSEIIRELPEDKANLLREWRHKYILEIGVSNTLSAHDLMVADSPNRCLSYVRDNAASRIGKSVFEAPGVVEEERLIGYVDRSHLFIYRVFVLKSHVGWQ